MVDTGIYWLVLDTKWHKLYAFWHIQNEQLTLNDAHYHVWVQPACHSVRACNSELRHSRVFYNNITCVCVGGGCVCVWGGVAVHMCVHCLHLFPEPQNNSRILFSQNMKQICTCLHSLLSRVTIVISVCSQTQIIFASTESSASTSPFCRYQSSNWPYNATLLDMFSRLSPSHITLNYHPNQILASVATF